MKTSHFRERKAEVNSPNGKVRVDFKYFKLILNNILDLKLVSFPQTSTTLQDISSFKSHFIFLI